MKQTAQWQTNTTLETVVSLRIVTPGAEFCGDTLHNVQLAQNDLGTLTKFPFYDML